MIGYSVEITNSNYRKRSETRVQVDDTTTIMEASTPSLESNDTYIAVSGFVVVTLASGTHDIDLDYRALSSTARVRRARLQIYALP